MSTRDTTLGNRLRALRTEKGLSQSDLAAAVRIMTKHTISKMERGAQDITSAQIETLARALGIPPARFFEGGAVRPAAELAEDVTPYVPPPDSFPARIPLQDNESWYRVGESRLDEIGIVDGQEIVVSIARDALGAVRTGDVVVANRYSRDGRTAETILRQFIEPHLLITNSRRRNLPPVNLESEAASILGVVVYPARPRS